VGGVHADQSSNLLARFVLLAPCNVVLLAQELAECYMVVS
jgi:hypothetical protein